MAETIALSIIQTVDVWLWGMILLGFFVMWRPFNWVGVRYFHVFLHPLAGLCMLCRGRDFWLDAMLAFIWIMLTFNWLILVRKAHLGKEADEILRGDRRLEGLEEFLTTGLKLGKYKYQRLTTV